MGDLVPPGAGQGQVRSSARSLFPPLAEDLLGYHLRLIRSPNPHNLVAAKGR